MDYPSIVGIVSLLGLDPVTVWYEYKIPFFAGLGLAVCLLAVLAWFLARQVKAMAATFHYGFTDRQPFYRKLADLDESVRPRIEEVLSGETLLFAMPAIAAKDVQGFSKTVGYLVLSPTRLIFTPKSGTPVKHADFDLLSFPDANVLDGHKNIELKLILPSSKPVFQLLGVSRDHAQELFMKMHALRQRAPK